MKKAFHRLRAGDLGLMEYHENPVITANGEERIIAWRNTVLRDEAGHISGTLSSGK